MSQILRVTGIPSERQKLFFSSKARYTAYGGARGGGKSWALRRKLVLLCLTYKKLHCLLVRRTYSELRTNHVEPLLREYPNLITWHEASKRLDFPNGSSISLGYCSASRDVLRYQGQEYDVIAIDEATQLSEYQFSVFKACLRGTRDVPRRMYLTCNPGGIGHAWVKRLFVDRSFKPDENPADYAFVPAKVYDNPILLSADPEYVRQLESLPPSLRDAWLDGRWDVFDGQFLPEFRPEVHVVTQDKIPDRLRYFMALDYGFDMLAVLLLGVDRTGDVWVLSERCGEGLILRDAGLAVAELAHGFPIEYLVASPDLWNRRQDTGRSGFEIMQSVRGVPPMQPADDRRIAGWRVLREFLKVGKEGTRLHISDTCRTLIKSLPELLYSATKPEDASDEPHEATHAPEALRYALMSRFCAFHDVPEPDRNFRFYSEKPSHPLF